MKRFKVEFITGAVTGKIYSVEESPDGNLIELEKGEQVIKFNYINANENGTIINLPNREMKVLALLSNGFEILWYNEYHKCFDDSDGDDYKYNLEQIIAWAELPEPKEVEE